MRYSLRVWSRFAGLHAAKYASTGAATKGPEPGANFSARHPHSGDQTEGRDRTTRADKAKHYTIARGSAMESASHLDVMRLDELTDAELYARRVELLERIVAMLTKLINPCSSRASFTAHAGGPLPQRRRLTGTLTPRLPPAAC